MAELADTRVAPETLTRAQWLAGVLAVGLANGFALPVIRSAGEFGWLDALFKTFGISAIVWIACMSGVWLLAKAGGAPVTRRDLAVGAVALVLFVLPFGLMNWVVTTALSVYTAATSRPGTAARRGALILLAVTVPMCWGPLLFIVAAPPILTADAVAVSAIIGTARTGNVVAFAGAQGTFQIYPGCSSLSNMSLALVAWVTATQLTARRWAPSDLLWYGLACISVIAVNVARLSLIGLYPEAFDLIHGPVGSAIAGWATLGLIVGICLLGVRRDLFASA
jgi:exosortase/archaeosortase family protein